MSENTEDYECYDPDPPELYLGDFGYWCGKDKFIRISEMKTFHIKNCIRLLGGKWMDKEGSNVKLCEFELELRLRKLEGKNDLT